MEIKGDGGRRGMKLIWIFQRVYLGLRKLRGGYDISWNCAVKVYYTVLIFVLVVVSSSKRK